MIFFNLFYCFTISSFVSLFFLPLLVHDKLAKKQYKELLKISIVVIISSMFSFAFIFFEKPFNFFNAFLDINLYLSQLQLLYQRCTDGAIRKLIIQDLNKANAFMGAEYNVVDTEYFILFKERKLEVVQKRIHNLIAGLANASMNSTQVSNSDLRMILDNFLNGGMTTTFGTVRVS